MSEKTLKFSNIKLNKKECHKSKKPIDLLSVDVDQLVFNKFLTDFNIITKALSILLVIQKAELLNHYVLLYLK